VERRALENVARGLNDAAAEQARLRGVTREIADFAATQMKGTIEEAGVTTRQLLKNVPASLYISVAGEAILKCYTKKRGSSSPAASVPSSRRAWCNLCQRPKS
jgi:hypothetical protein